MRHFRLIFQAFARARPMLDDAQQEKVISFNNQQVLHHHRKPNNQLETTYHPCYLQHLEAAFAPHSGTGVFAANQSASARTSGTHSRLKTLNLTGQRGLVSSTQIHSHKRAFPFLFFLWPKLVSTKEKIPKKKRGCPGVWGLDREIQARHSSAIASRSL